MEIYRFGDEPYPVLIGHGKPEICPIQTDREPGGNSGHAQSSGNSSVAVSLGRKGTARASGKCKFIVLADWRDGELVDVKVGRVGDNIKLDKSYSIVNGDFQVKPEL